MSYVPYNTTPGLANCAASSHAERPRSICRSHNGRGRRQKAPVHPPLIRASGAAKWLAFSAAPSFQALRGMQVNSGNRPQAGALCVLSSLHQNGAGIKRRNKSRLDVAEGRFRTESPSALPSDASLSHPRTLQYPVKDVPERGA